MNHRTQTLRISATPSRLAATTPWNPESLIKVGLFFLATGVLLQALQSPR